MQLTAEPSEELARCAVVFEAADPPRESRLAFWQTTGGPLPDETQRIGANYGDVTVVRRARPDSNDVRRKTVPAVRLPMGQAIAVLGRARRSPGSHPAAAAWGAATVIALQLIARGRLLPGVSEAGYDAWRVGPLDTADTERIQQVADALPPEARAVALPETKPLTLPDAYQLVRSYIDAVADTLVRTPGAATLVGTPTYASPIPQQVPHLRSWAQESAAGLDAGVRISLRVVFPAARGGLRRASDLDDLQLVVNVHSLSDPSLVLDAADLWSGPHQGFDARARIDVMVAVRRASRVWPPLARLGEQAVPDRITLDDAELDTLLGPTAGRLAASGVEVRWPKELIRELTASAVIARTEKPPTDIRSFLSGDSVLSFDWQLALGDDPLTEQEMDALASSKRPVVRLRDRWLLVDPELVRKARERRISTLTPLDALALALAGTSAGVGEQGQPVEVTASPWLEALRKHLADPDAGAVMAHQPEELNATLRDYQLRGLRWLDRMTSLGLGGCLADDMGLGKTITLISLHLRRNADPATRGPTLVVCPASLLGNWQREIERFAPGTEVRRFHGTTRTLEGADEGFVLTTYGTMRSDATRIARHEPAWALVVADEAQHVKNPLSRTAKALRTIPAGARVALTGTPVENNLSELWAILDWTTPSLLGTLPAFRERWARPIEAQRDDETAQRLSRLVRPFLLRRKKSDPGIAPELPPKTQTNHPVTLTKEQVGLYQAVVSETLAQIKDAEGIARRGLIMKLLTACKQICNHPAHYLDEAHGPLRRRSGKLELLDELVSTIGSEDGAVLVFTQYVAMGRLLERHLRERGVDSLFLHGGTTVRRREEMVDAFQAGQVPVFVLSLKAAGTGLNLTRADHVIHYDRWWNPAVEDQATDRAYRIGQTRSVQVHRLIAEGTVEDRIAEMIASKRELADAVVSSGEAALTELSNADLADLVKLRSAR